MSADWEAKIKALLRCPPEGCLLPDDETKARAKELLVRLGISDDLTEDIESAHRGAFGVESLLAGAAAADEKLVARHPLSAQAMTICPEGASFRDLGKEARDAVDSAIQTILKAGGDTLEARYLTLWRMLPDLLADSSLAPRLGPRWSALPATAALPSQPVWQHARIASALAGAGPRPAVLVFNIASAQEFLAMSRRTQDLWMGSFILSYLTWKGMAVLARELGPDCVVLPDLLGQPLVDLWLRREKGCNAIPEPSLAQLRAANIPNVFTAIVPVSQAEALAGRVEDAVYQAWHELAGTVRGYVERAANRSEDGPRGLDKDGVWEDLWERQTARFLRPDVFWALSKWPEVPGDVEAAWAQATRVVGSRVVGEASETWRSLRGGRSADGGESGALYGLQAALAGRALEARKNLRAFTQTSEGAEKCTLCGQRSALHPAAVLEDDRVDYRALARFWTDLGRVGGSSSDEGGKLIGRIRRGERLCSVCLTKRLAWEGFFLAELGFQESRKEAHVFFPSTSSMATAAFRRNILQKLAAEPNDPAARALGGSLGAFVATATPVLRGLGILFWSAQIGGLTRALQRAVDVGHDADTLHGFLRMDGDWLYESSFEADSIVNEYGVSDVAMRNAIPGLRAAQSALRGLVKAAGDAGIAPPDTYYALVAMDGDRIGEWLAGQRAPLLHEIVDQRALSAQSIDTPCGSPARRPPSAAAQEALAEAAKTFALRVVPHVVEETHCGCVIYAGGDDALAFVPLDELLDVLRELRNGYEGGDDGWWLAQPSKTCHLAMGNQATTSAGVVVAHHAHPFSEVVEVAHARALENDAKETLGRDAFSIRVLKRSGEELQAGAKWRCGLSSCDVLKTVETVVKALSGAKEGVSDRFVKDLSAERALSALPFAAQEAELGRLIGRRTLSDASEQTSVVQELHKRLVELLRSLAEEATEAHPEAARAAPVAYDQFLGLLNLARFLSTGRRSE